MKRLLYFSLALIYNAACISCWWVGDVYLGLGDWFDDHRQACASKLKRTAAPRPNVKKEIINGWIHYR